MRFKQISAHLSQKFLQKSFKSKRVTKVPLTKFQLHGYSGAFPNFTLHCVKNVRIRSYSGLHFSRIFPHSDWIWRDRKYLSLFSPKAGKMPTRITPNLDTFYAVNVALFITSIQRSFLQLLILFHKSTAKKQIFIN